MIEAIAVATDYPLASPPLLRNPTDAIYRNRLSKLLIHSSAKLELLRSVKQRNIQDCRLRHNDRRTYERADVPLELPPIDQRYFSGATCRAGFAGLRNSSFS